MEFLLRELVSGHWRTLHGHNIIFESAFPFSFIFWSFTGKLLITNTSDAKSIQAQSGGHTIELPLAENGKLKIKWTPYRFLYSRFDCGHINVTAVELPMPKYIKKNLF